MRYPICISIRLLLPLVALATLWPLASSAQSDLIDPEAVNLLRRSTDYLASLKKFRMESYSSIETVMQNGEKLQFDTHTAATIQRPNKMRIERIGEIVDQTFYYDGKVLSVNIPYEHYYASVSAPATIDETLDFATNQLDVIAPGSDLLYASAFERLSSGLTSARIIGENVVAGVRCDHLAFRNAEVDWQICIEQGKNPLPRKLVVTSKKMEQAPQFVTVISHWNTAPKFAQSIFDFAPDKSASKIDFLPPASAAK